MKKSLLSLLLLLLSMVASAHDFYVDGIYYNVNGNEVAVTSSPSSNRYRGIVVIPRTVTYSGNIYYVTSIGDYAFSTCMFLTSVTIPNSVNSIGIWAFNQCSGLTNITIPNSVTFIGTEAFHRCSGLTNITIPNSVTFIGDYTFTGCSNLTSVEIGNAVTSIGESPLSDCPSLSRIIVQNGNPVYDSRDNCNAIIETASNTLIAGCKNTIIPNSVTSIGDYAFSYCSSLTSITIPNSVTSIDKWAFYNCTGLTAITFPNSITSINEGSFCGCESLTSITIPSSVTYIGNIVFSDCPSLTRMTVQGGNPIYDSRDDCNAIIETASNTLIAGCKNTIIPNSVKSIGNWSMWPFWNCSNLISIVIPDSVTSIGNFAFEFCYSLTDIIIPNSVTSIGIGAFEYCTNLSIVNIGMSVTSIGKSAFAYCDSITNIYCYASTPPTCDDNTFSNYSATLHVPAASLAAYFTASYWSNFENIIGDAVAPTGISISSDSINLQPGEQLTLMATVTPQNASNKEITWISTDTTVAIVNNGVVHAVGCGECDIIASCFGMQAVCHVSVAIRISLDQQEAMLLPNHILTLTPMPSAPGIYAVSSSDPAVAAARILSSGIVQVVGIKEGTTTITVSSIDGAAIPATCLVTVYTETGDMDCDGFVAISDVTSLIDYLLNGDSSLISTKNADVDGDGNISINDVTVLIDALLHNNEQSSLRKIKDWGE